MDPATRRLTALLGPLTNYERLRPDRIRWSLDNMRALLARPGFALPAARAVQIGGSKGKGTTTLYLESLASAVGLRTGSYLSPHLQSLLERVRIEGREVAEDELARSLAEVLAFAREVGMEPTFFEVMTAAALGCFAARPLELIALEVGLGGRLDATTAVPVDAAIVTHVELEHTGLLGDTVEAIAAEKACIVRPGRPAFTAATEPARRVIAERAQAVGAELAVLDRDFGLADLREERGAVAGVLWDAGGARLPFRLPDARAFELPAFALAAACLRRLWPDRPLPLDPVPRPYLPGRCELFRCGDGVPLVLDAAHTESSLRALAGELERRFPERRPAVLFASSRDKRWREGLKWLLPLADTFFVTALADVPMVPPDEIVSWLRDRGVRAEPVETTAAGLQRLARAGQLRVVTGSFYVVGDARAQLHLLGVEGSR